MKFFKKTSVAILLTALLVALCCVWGYSRAYEASHSDPDSVVQSQRAGESGLNYFLNWIDDGAGLFSMETTDTLARNNLDLNNTYGCLLALKTVNYLNGQDIASYSKDLFQQVDLGRKDMLLVIESSSQAWYLVYGGGLRTYAENNDALAALLKDNLDTDFFQGESDAGILSLFDDLEHWCAETLPVLDDTPEPGNPFLQNDNKVQILSLGDVLLGILFTLLVNIWWIILLLVVLNLIDRHRFREYITKHPPGSLSNPPVFFRPLLFWHGQGSSWYRRMLYLVTEAPTRTTTISRTTATSRAPMGPAARRRTPTPAPGRMWGRRPRDSGETPRKRSAGSTAASGERGAAFGTWGGNGCTCSRTKSAACSVGGACSPLSPFFWIPWAEVSSFPGFFAPALKRQPHRLEILSRTGGVFRPFLAFSPHASGVFASSTGWGGRSPFTATQRLILVPMLWNFSS